MAPVATVDGRAMTPAHAMNAPLEPPTSNPLDWIDAELAAMENRDLLRRSVVVETASEGRFAIDGQPLINFGSNDYLGLAADPRLAAAAAEACAGAGWGSGASPLVTGRTLWHARLEAQLAAFEGTEAAILFPTGYAANAGTIPALVGEADAIFADAKNHASIIDGCRLARAQRHVYRHGDCQHLAWLLEQAGSFRRRLIVTDSLFSMDGDLAPLDGLAQLARRFDAMLMVDEAHATGVFGARGRGVVEMAGVEHAIDIRVGTLSKALGSSGGFVCGKQPLVDWLRNRARPYVFSTAAPAATCAAAAMAVRIVGEDPTPGAKLLATADRLRAALRDQGWNVGRSESQIVPVIVGEAGRAVELARQLREAGLFVPAIRPPSVPSGESLLRISIATSHAPSMIERLQTALGGRACQSFRDPGKRVAW